MNPNQSIIITRQYKKSLPIKDQTTYRTINQLSETDEAHILPTNIPFSFFSARPEHKPQTSYIPTRPVTEPSPNELSFRFVLDRSRVKVSHSSLGSFTFLLFDVCWLPRRPHSISVCSVFGKSNGHFINVGWNCRPCFSSGKFFRSFRQLRK